MLAYSLTNLTGARKSSERRAVVLTMEVQRRPFLLSLVGVPVGAAIGAVIMLVLGSATRLFGLQVNFTVLVFVMPIVASFALIWLFDSRQRNGMRLTQYKALVNKGRAKGRGGNEASRTGVVLINGRIPERPSFILHQPISVERTAPGTDETAPVVAGVASKRQKKPRRFNLEEL